MQFDKYKKTFAFIYVDKYGNFTLFAKSVISHLLVSHSNQWERGDCVKKYKLGRFLSMKPLFRIKLKENCHLLLRFSHGEEDCGQSGHNKCWKGRRDCPFIQMISWAVVPLCLLLTQLHVTWTCFENVLAGKLRVIFIIFMTVQNLWQRDVRNSNCDKGTRDYTVGCAVNFLSRGETEAKLFSLRNENSSFFRLVRI